MTRDQTYGFGQVLFRSQVDPNVGVEPVLRSAALASAFAQLGGQVTLACDRHLPKSLQRRLSQQGIELVVIQDDTSIGDATQTRQIAENLQADWIVVDGPKFDENYLQVLRLSLARLAVIGDTRHSVLHAHLILDQRFSSESYSDGKVLAGPRYYASANDPSAPRKTRATPKTVKRILLNLWNSHDLVRASQCLAAIHRLPDSHRYSIDLVQSAPSIPSSQLKELHKRYGITICVHSNRDRLAALLKLAQISICDSNGSTGQVIESGLPTLVIAPDAELNRSINFVVPIPESLLETTEAFTKKLSSVFSSESRRRSLSENAGRTFDGQGANRIARRMLSTQMTFRNAAANDLDVIQRWNTQHYPFGAASPDAKWYLDNHAYLQQLDNHQLDLWMVEIDDEPIGAVEVEFASSDTNATMNVRLSPQWSHSNQLGIALIEAASRQAFDSDDIESIESRIDLRDSIAYDCFIEAGFEAPSAWSAAAPDFRTLVLKRSLPSNNSKSQINSWRKSA